MTSPRPRCATPRSRPRTRPAWNGSNSAIAGWPSRGRPCPNSRPRTRPCSRRAPRRTQPRPSPRVSRCLGRAGQLEPIPGSDRKAHRRRASTRTGQPLLTKVPVQPRTLRDLFVRAPRAVSHKAGRTPCPPRPGRCRAQPRKSRRQLPPRHESNPNAPAVRPRPLHLRLRLAVRLPGPARNLCRRPVRRGPPLQGRNVPSCAATPRRPSAQKPSPAAGPRSPRRLPRGRLDRSPSRVPPHPFNARPARRP